MFETKYYDESAMMYASGCGRTELARVTKSGNKDAGRVDIIIATPRGNGQANVNFLEGNIDIRMGEIDRHYLGCIEGYEDVITEIAKSYIC